MMQVILDADLLIDYLLWRRESEKLGDIIENQLCQLFITELGLSKIRSVANKMPFPEVAEEFVSGIENKITVCPINNDLIEQAKLLNCKDFESALEVACAISNGFSRILTRNPQNFDGTDFPICLIEHFPTPPQLDEFLHFLLGVDWAENLYLSDLNIPSLHPLEVVGIMEYRIRNSISTVMEFFLILKKEGSQGITCQELENKYEYSESKITNILLDLQVFKMATIQGDRVTVQQILINSDNISIANYLAKTLNQHIVVQKVYKQIKLNEGFTRQYLKMLIREVYPEDKYKNKPLKKCIGQVYSLPLIFDIYSDKNSIATKSAGDYVSRMLGWLLFTGLLEQKNKEVIRIPIKVNEGKQKGKLLQENAIPQLEVDMSIKQLELFVN